MSYLYILEINPLSVALLADILPFWELSFHVVYGRKVLEGGVLYVYIGLTHFIVQLRLTRHCKAIILQLKNKKECQPRLLLFVVFVAKLCPTLLRPMDCSPPVSSVHGDFPGTNNGAGCHFFLQGIFPIQGLNQKFLHWQADSLPPIHSGKPINLIGRYRLGAQKYNFAMKNRKFMDSWATLLELENGLGPVYNEFRFNLNFGTLCIFAYLILTTLHAIWVHLTLQY